MTPIRRAYLASMAEREVAAREKHYPDMIEKGEIERGDADSDLSAWRTIARLFAGGVAEESAHSWAELELATARALQRRCEEADAKPGDERLLERRIAVEAILRKIAFHREFFGPLAAYRKEAA